MIHPIHRVTGFTITGPYTLLVAFADGTEQRIDLAPVLHGRLFGPLRDLATFNAVVLDSEAGTLVWVLPEDLRVLGGVTSTGTPSISSISFSFGGTPWRAPVSSTCIGTQTGALRPGRREIIGPADKEADSIFDFVQLAATRLLAQPVR
jgi:Protein of unknown function (DUF2442)